MPASPKVVDEDEDVYAGDGMSSSEHVPAAAPSSTLLSDAPPPLDRTSNSAMTDIHDIDSFFAPLGNPARLNAFAGLARPPSAWIDGTPSILPVPELPSGAVVQSTQHVLHDAPVRASCWSYPGGELVPSTMSRPWCPPTWLIIKIPTLVTMNSTMTTPKSHILSSQGFSPSSPARGL